MLDLDHIEEGPPSVVADPASAGYEGNTQFVDLNQLMASSPQATTMPMDAVSVAGQMGAGGVSPAQDNLLAQTYQFGPEAVQQYGTNTLIFARNQQGQDIVLKRIWEGTFDQIPERVRAKLAQLGLLQHPGVTRMHGMFASPSGCWVELERPLGARLSFVLQSGPPQTPEQVAAWAKPVSEALALIHNQELIYGNMTSEAIWVDAASGQVKLEPFDVLAFVDRSSEMGPFAPP